jgi:hypothetical protein
MLHPRNLLHHARHVFTRITFSPLRSIPLQRKCFSIEHPDKMSTEEYSTNLLPRQIKEFWNDPERLYITVNYAVERGCSHDVLYASDQLVQIEQEMPYKAQLLRAIVLMNNNLFDQAEVYAEQADTSVIMMAAPHILNEIREKRKQDDLNRSKEEREMRRQEFLEKLTQDPNHEQFLERWINIHAREKVDFNEVTTIPGAWRSLLYEARYALKDGKSYDQVQHLYKKVLNMLDKMTNEEQSELMFIIEKDLLQLGLNDEMIALIKPVYQWNAHRIEIGVYLVDAYRKQGRKSDGLMLTLKLLMIDNLPSHYERFLELNKEFFAKDLDPTGN